MGEVEFYSLTLSPHSIYFFPTLPLPYTICVRPISGNVKFIMKEGNQTKVRDI